MIDDRFGASPCRVVRLVDLVCGFRNPRAFAPGVAQAVRDLCRRPPFKEHRPHRLPPRSQEWFVLLVDRPQPVPQCVEGLRLWLGRALSPRSQSRLTIGYPPPQPPRAATRSPPGGGRRRPDRQDLLSSTTAGGRHQCPQVEVEPNGVTRTQLDDFIACSLENRDRRVTRPRRHHRERPTSRPISLTEAGERPTFVTWT